MAKKNSRNPFRQVKKDVLILRLSRWLKSPKTGAYIFDEQMVPNEKVQDFFKK
mgnify:CR=1 FL=1